jgi:hypothetical protein
VSALRLVETPLTLSPQSLMEALDRLAGRSMVAALLEVTLAWFTAEGVVGVADALPLAVVAEQGISRRRADPVVHPSAPMSQGDASLSAAS